MHIADHVPDLGRRHPTMDGVPAFTLDVSESGAIRALEMQVGQVHRGAEKLLESRDVAAGLALSDRHDWLGAFCSELGLALTVEAACGIVAPPRAQLVRTILAECNRVGHHLAFLAGLPGADPGWAGHLWTFREQTLDAMQAATGQRIHPMFVVVGGVRADLADPVVELLRDALGGWGLQAGELLDALPDVLASYRGLARVAHDDAVAFGASGPVARASGLDIDLRRDNPSLPYPADLRVPTSRFGDAAARLECLAAEIPVSLAVMDWAAAALEPGPVAVRLPKVLRVPAGTYYGAFENPGGINGYLLVSRNEPIAYRVKIRSHGFGNAALCEHALVGTELADLPQALASFFLLSGDIDR